MSTPYRTFWTVNVYSDDSKGSLIASTANVMRLETDEQENVVSTYKLTLNLADPLTAGLTKGCYVEILTGRTTQTLRYSGYISQITQQPGAGSTYDLDIDDSMIVLTEFRCPDGMALNYPHYKGIDQALNGVRDKISPGNQGMLPPGWTFVWLDPHWSYQMNTTVTGMSSNGASPSVVTVSTNASHNLIVGDKIIVKGTGASGYNGQFTVASVTNTTHFTYTSKTNGLGASGSIAGVSVTVLKGGSVAPGVGDSWATALETPLVNLQTLAAHYGFTFRCRPGSTRSSGVVEGGPLGDDSGLVAWGGDTLRKEIKARTGVDYPRPNTGVGQTLGLAQIIEPQLTDTLDTVYNLYIGPGMGPGHDSITLQSFWALPPDQYAAAHPTVVGVANPWQPKNPGRTYYLGPSVTNWDGASYTLVAFRRNDGTWEFGVIDVPSAQKYGVREQLLQRKNRKIVDAFELLSACIGNVAYNKDPVPSMALRVLHPRTSANGTPTRVRPGQLVTVNYQGVVWAYVLDTDSNSDTYGCLIPYASNPYTYLKWPTVTDPKLVRLQQRVKQVQEVWDQVGGHSATYTLGRAQYHWGLFDDALAKDLQDLVTSQNDNKSSFVQQNFGGNIAFLCSQTPDAYVDPATNGKAAVLQPGAYMVSNVPDDRFFGDHTLVRFSVILQDNLQYFDFLFNKPVWNLKSINGAASYGIFRLALSQSGLRTGFHWYGGSGNATAVGIVPKVKFNKFTAGTYDVSITWSKGIFRAWLSFPNPNKPSVNVQELVGYWHDTSGTATYNSTTGAIGWNLGGGSLPCTIDNVSLNPWRYTSNITIG